IFEITPIAVTGILTGAAVQSPSVGPVVPANTAPTATDLSITGITEVGQVLTGNYTFNDADGDLEGTSLFRWFRDGVEISGATAVTYTLTTSDENTTITFEVTPVALTGVLTGAAVVSAGVGPIGSANAIPTATDVLISGNTEVGQELTGSYTFDDLDGDLEGTSTFRWLRDDVEIAGATALTYSLVDLDQGTNIIFEVTPVAATGASPGSPVQSPAVGPIDAANEPPVATDLSITGGLEVGQVLTGVYTYSDPDGDLEGLSTFRWLRDGVAIIGATAINYTLQDTDEGANISFEVVPVALTGDTPGSPSQSASVGPVLPANTAPVASSVSITGSTEVGLSLTGSYNYSDADGDLEGTSTFRWLRDNVEIAGATALSYTLQSADEGATILFEVTPVALTGVLTGNPVLSSAVGPIGAANTIPTALDVNISGTAEVGQQITGVYTFSDADGDQEGTSAYRWLRDDTAIPGETDINYTVASADLDAFITFEITPVSLTGATPGSPVQSAPIGPVVPANSAPIAAVVTISGTAEEGQQLNGLYTFTDADGDLEGNSTFRWLRDGVAIDGAIAQSYRLESADVGTSIIFEVTPAASTGVSPGRPVQSASIGPIRAADIEPISITPVNLPRLYNAGIGSVTYNISVSGDIEVERVLFIFKGLTAGDDGWVTRDLTSSTGQYAVTLTEEAFDEMGLEYEFVASDVEGNSVNLLGYTYVQYPVEGMDFESLVFGNSVSDYNLISFPLELDNPSINSVLEDDLGPYDQAEWRLFGHLNTGVLEYQSGLSVFERGKGYWLIVRNPTDIDSGPGSTELITDQEYQMALEPGWNLIGNPYSFNLSWQDVLAVNPLVEGVDAQLTLYEGGYQNGDVLNILEGAFVFSEQNVTLSVPLQKDEAIQGGRIPPPDLEKSMTSESWEIQLEVSSDLLSNQVGGFGMNVDAKESKDAWDGIRPPRFLEYLDISFEHQEYFAPNFSRDIVPLEENQIWNFTVESNVKQERLTLDWESLAQLDPHKELWLVHSDLQRAINMKILQRYVFKYQAINNFKIVYGSSHFVNENLLPESASIAAAYPNPFTEQLKVAFALPENQNASQVDLAIYDLQGRKVKSLWQDRYQPGFYETIWDGTNTTGKAVSSGVYLLRMNVSGQESIYRRVVKY
ncbi:MAG: T9SS type A sorting domain-containing protein, partial [Cyclobacteriaceae bacterium]|nr:T9SS type A sorting domain-containing protein [Cyclobacteriaceae bacterium]